VLPFSSSSSSSSPTPHDNNTKFKQTKESYGRAPTYDNHHECCHEKCLAPPQQDKNKTKTKNANEIGPKKSHMKLYPSYPK